VRDAGQGGTYSRCRRAVGRTSNGAVRRTSNGRRWKCRCLKDPLVRGRRRLGRQIVDIRPQSGRPPRIQPCHLFTRSPPSPARGRSRCPSPFARHSASVLGAKSRSICAGVRAERQRETVQCARATDGGIAFRPTFPPAAGGESRQGNLPIRTMSRGRAVERPIARAWTDCGRAGWPAAQRARPCLVESAFRPSGPPALGPAARRKRVT